MLSDLHSLNLKLCSKQYNKNFVLELIVVPQLSGDWQHNYSTKTRQAGQANGQSMYYLMSMVEQLSLSYPAQQSVTTFIAMIVTILVTPKAATKRAVAFVQQTSHQARMKMLSVS
jgi:hypothetical protein